MGRRIADMVGWVTQSGFLTVDSFAGRSGKGAALWLCRCVCGNVCFRTTSDLRNGRAISCGHRRGCRSQALFQQRKLEADRRARDMLKLATTEKINGAELARRLGISRQRASQILSRARRLEE